MLGEKTWESQIGAIPLRSSLTLRIKKSATSVDIFCKDFSGVIGSGPTAAEALEMFFDHLIISYYEYSLNPGPLTECDRLFGIRVKKLFNREREGKRLLNFSP